MRILKPHWVSHDDMPIFSIDIHPDGSRFVTGGQGKDSGLVVIWNFAPLIKKEVEADENVPKLLCQIDSHLACVNCVRWSGSGKLLASAGDDKLVMIWKFAKYPQGSNAVFGSKGKVNVETWRCISTLRAHSGDILDVAWSPQDIWLATASVDNTIIIWDATKLPEIVTILKGHTGMVKGVTWDPIGKYLSSQSEDKSLRIWRTIDWQTEAVITKPFETCSGTTAVLRHCWSPDGQYLVTAHAMNNRGPTAQIVERNGWKHKKDYAGHRKAVTCVRFSSNIMQKHLSEDERYQQMCICALGSRDNGISVWMTGFLRPIVVMENLFDGPVLDLSWSATGNFLLACSFDGTISTFIFNKEEIGTPLTTQQRDELYETVYGTSTICNHQLSAQIIENPDLLECMENFSKREKKNSDYPPNNPKPLTPNKMPNSTKQIETRTTDGRRRITPIYIPPAADDNEDGPSPFRADITPFSESTDHLKNKILSEKTENIFTKTCNTSTKTDENTVNSTFNAVMDSKMNCLIAEPPTPFMETSRASPCIVLSHTGAGTDTSITTTERDQMRKVSVTSCVRECNPTSKVSPDDSTSGIVPVSNIGSNTNTLSATSLNIDVISNKTIDPKAVESNIPYTELQNKAFNIPTLECSSIVTSKTNDPSIRDDATIEDRQQTVCESNTSKSNITVLSKSSVAHKINSTLNKPENCVMSASTLKSDTIAPSIPNLSNSTIIEHKLFDKMECNVKLKQEEIPGRNLSKSDENKMVDKVVRENSMNSVAELSCMTNCTAEIGNKSTAKRGLESEVSSTLDQVLVSASYADIDTNAVPKSDIDDNDSSSSTDDSSDENSDNSDGEDEEDNSDGDDEEDVKDEEAEEEDNPSDNDDDDDDDDVNDVTTSVKTTICSNDKSSSSKSIPLKKKSPVCHIKATDDIIIPTTKCESSPLAHTKMDTSTTGSITCNGIPKPISPTPTSGESALQAPQYFLGKNHIAKPAKVAITSPPMEKPKEGGLKRNATTLNLLAAKHPRFVEKNYHESAMHNVVEQKLETAVVARDKATLLPAMKLRPDTTISIGNTGKLHISHELVPGMPGSFSRIKLKLKETLAWEYMFGSVVIGASSNSHYVAVTLENRNLYLLEAQTGKYVLPPIVLSDKASHLMMNSTYLLCATCDAFLNVWDIKQLKMTIMAQPMSPILTSPSTKNQAPYIKKIIISGDGIPVVVLSTGRSFIFSPDLKSWLIAADNGDPLVQCTSQKVRQNTIRPSITHDYSQFPLFSLQTFLSSSTPMKLSHNSELSNICTLSFLEQQISTCMVLNSPQEFRHWLLVLVRFLLQQGESRRLRQICEELLGPVRQGIRSDDKVLSLSKHSLLRDVLKEIGGSVYMQRLFTEFNDQLNELTNHSSNAL